MKADTMYFGILEFSEKELIRFEEGLFGFENRKDFLPVAFEEEDTILCLQSIEDRDLSFILMNPFRLLPDYNPVLQPGDYEKLGTDKEELISFYVISVIRSTPEESTVNLKCPVAVNSETRKAVQVILESKEYGFRHSLSEFTGKEE